MFQGKENAISAKRMKENQEDAIIVGFGQSMTPILKSGEPCYVAHLTEEMVIRKGDIVFCKVNGHYYLHKVHAVKGDRYLIGNNHGHMNGWTGRNNIFGKVVNNLDKK